MSNASSFLSGAIVPWVSGTTYAVNRVVTSPADNYQTYIRVVAGAGTTDPSADATNWKPFGARAIKSIQRGTISMNRPDTVINATISSVVTGKSLLSKIGHQIASGPNNDIRIALTNATTITAYKPYIDDTASVAVVVGWELVEYY